MRMIRRFRAVLKAAALVLAVQPIPASAMFAKMSEEELVASSAVIVVGTLGAARRANGYALAPIEVQQVLAGEPSEGARPMLRIPHPDAPASSSDIVHQPGQTGLWYLRHAAGEAGHYLADHPQRFVPMPQAREAIERLKSR